MSALSTSDAFLEATFGDQALDKLLELLRIAEMAERYDDMCFFVSKIVAAKSELKQPLSIEERHFLSVAFKNAVGSKRAAWRTLGPDESDDAENGALIRSYRTVVETELRAKSKEILDLLDRYLIHDSTGKQDETEVFYLKMAGDYYRYLCEFDSGEENVNKTRDYYQRAWDVAKEHLSEVSPTRLGLALNFSVCHYEILKDSSAACEMAKEAFDEAIDKLDDIEDSSYKDATLIMQLLRDNLTLWTSEQGDDE